MSDSRNPESRNKLKMLYLRDIFMNYSDEEHYITLPQIRQKLEEFGIKAARKALYDDIESLRAYGMNIVLDRNKGYRLLDERFTSAEIKVMVDEIASSRLLTDENAAKLVSKIEKLGNSFVEYEHGRSIYVSERPKNTNDRIYEVIDIISKAINEKRVISFNYFDYTVRKRRKFRDGIYKCSPYALTFNEEKYYLISYCDRHPSAFTHFRVDHMTNVVITDEPAVIQNSELNIEEYMESTFSMFSGRTEAVTMRFENRFVNAVLDRFGYETKLHPVDDEHFSFTVNIKTEHPEPFFAWIFKFNGGAEILEPLTVRDNYFEMLHKSIGE